MKKITTILFCVFILAVAAALFGMVMPSMSAEEFIELCRTGTPAQIKEAIEGRSNVNAKDKNGVTALMCAVRYNKDPEVSRALIQRGADVNAKDNNGATALMASFRDVNPEIPHMLIQGGANVNAKHDNGGTPLLIAAAKDNAEVLNVLIRAGADINAKSGTSTAMFFATAAGGPDVVSLLLAAGAEVSETDVMLAQMNERLKDTPVVEEMKKRL